MNLVMKSAFLFCFLFLNTFSLPAQSSYFDSDDFWHKLSLKKLNAPANIKRSDTAVVIASNRVFNDTTLRFLPDSYRGGIQYFVVYSGEGKWNIIPVSSLERAVSYLPDKNKDWVVYTEGMGKLFTTGADRAMQMSAQYDLNLIYFDYPSLKAKWRRTRNYYFSKHNARVSYRDFAPVLDTIRMIRQAGLIGNKSINLFFHSMGNIILEQMAKKGNACLIEGVPWIDNLILNAPCVPQHGHKKWLDNICITKRIYVLYNPQDFTLGGAYLLSKQHQLGMNVKQPVSKKAIYINFETLAGKKHSNFLSLRGYPPRSPAATRLYETLLHGETTNVDDTTQYRVSLHRGIGWDILP